MSDDKLRYLQWSAIDKINHLVECKASFEDRNAALKLVRDHLDARIGQTAVPYIVAPLEPFTIIESPGGVQFGESCLICGDSHGALPCPMSAGS